MRGLGASVAKRAIGRSMNKAVQDQFDRLAPDYERGTASVGWTGSAMVATEVRSLDQPMRDALIIGAGTGADIDPVREKVSGQIVALDISDRMLDVVRIGYPDVETQHADFLEWDGEGRSFDLLVCTGVLELVSDFEGFFQHSGRFLRPQGRLIVTHELLIQGHPDYGRHTVLKGVPHYRRPTQVALKLAGRNGLKLRSLKHFVAWIRDGQPVIYELLNLQKVG